VVRTLFNERATLFPTTESRKFLGFKSAGSQIYCAVQRKMCYSNPYGRSPIIWGERLAEAP
jgi:hypothetical protein